MERPGSMGSITSARQTGGHTYSSRSARTLAGIIALGLGSMLTSSAKAQPPEPQVGDITQRSGLLQRFSATPTYLPPDPRRDYFYNTRYGDKGALSHINWFRSQGLYGLGWKTPDSESIYPYWYGSPGQSTIDSSSHAWPRPLKFIQGLVHPWKPVGMYYQMGSYVPIYDLDPIAPGPGPWPFGMYFNFDHGG
jgi:hypothetical protein